MHPEKTFIFFRLSLKKRKCFRFQNLRIKQIQLIIDQYHFCLLTKSLEKHVHLYLNDYLEKQQLLHPFQSGFRRKYSCNTVLARLTNSWLTARNKSEVSGVVFLDLNKLSTWLIKIFYWRSSPCILKTQVLYHFLNRIFIIECNASYSMALTPPKNQ